MTNANLKAKISYEIRKGLHYLFYPFAIILCWHSPNGYIGYVMGFSLFMYAVDTLYVWVFMTEKTSTRNCQVLVNSGVQMTFTVSETFQNRVSHGGFVYVCFPWISRYQYHAFSVFENKLKPEERRIFMSKTGDWTNKLYQSLLVRDTKRPVWISGPFHSPFHYSEWYDRHILIASGIGITPVLSAIQAHQGTCRVNVIWAIRDPYLMEFILSEMMKICLDQSWILIYYTGKKRLEQRLLINLPSNIRIITERPKLHIVIPNIIYTVEYNVGKNTQTCYEAFYVLMNL